MQPLSTLTLGTAPYISFEHTELITKLTYTAEKRMLDTMQLMMMAVFTNHLAMISASMVGYV